MRFRLSYVSSGSVASRAGKPGEPWGKPGGNLGKPPLLGMRIRIGSGVRRFG